ncbi:MAG: hypothetical protein ABSD67_11550 [Terracidiphilus sp.]
METDFGTQTISKMPSELSGSVPRIIRQSDSRRRTNMNAAFMLGLLVIVALGICINQALHVHRRSVLRQEGTELVLGEIIEIKEQGRGPDIVCYTFTANGKTVTGNAGVPLKFRQPLRESKTLVVRYLPSNPAINHPAAWEYPYEHDPLWLLIMVLVLDASIVFLPSFFLYRFYKERKLLTWGKPAVGIVTKCVSVRRAFRLKYEFRTETGTTSNGGGWSFLPQAIGAEIWILYLPRSPRINLLYPHLEYTVE